MRTRVHFCWHDADAGLVTPLLTRLGDPRTGLLTGDRLIRGRFHEQDASATRERLREQIREAHVTACLVGPGTHTDPWIEWEIETSHEFGRGIVGVRLRTGIHDFMPRSLVYSGAQIVDMHPGSVIAAIERAAFVARTRQSAGD